MKHLIILLFTLTVLSWKEKDAGTVILTPGNLMQDTLTWIDNFRDFRDAVYHNNKVKLKEFFDFPIITETNDIWYFVHGNNEKALELLTGKAKPFTEKDLDKYYDKIFSKAFISSILKIKSEALLKSGSTETPEFKTGNTIYKMYATFEKADGLLRLNLALTTPVKNDDGTIDSVESNTIYDFSVSARGEVKFKQLRIAG